MERRVRVAHEPPDVVPLERERIVRVVVRSRRDPVEEIRIGRILYADPDGLVRGQRGGPRRPGRLRDNAVAVVQDVGRELHPVVRPGLVVEIDEPDGPPREPAHVVGVLGVEDLFAHVAVREVDVKVPDDIELLGPVDQHLVDHVCHQDPLGPQPVEDRPVHTVRVIGRVEGDRPVDLVHRGEVVLGEEDTEIGRLHLSAPDPLDLFGIPHLPVHAGFR